MDKSLANKVTDVRCPSLEDGPDTEGRPLSSSHQLSAGTTLGPPELGYALNDLRSGSSKASGSQMELHLAAHKTSFSQAEILLTKARLRI